MNKIQKNNRALLLILILLLIPGVSFAHGMDLILEEPGVLRVQYDGGGFSPRTEITIYDETGEEIAKGLVDEEGKFHFDKNLNLYRAVANDGMGHIAEYGEGASKGNIPKTPVIAGVFGVAGVLAYIFGKKNKKVKK